jgi:hypothetical protein
VMSDIDPEAGTQARRAATNEQLRRDAIARHQDFFGDPGATVVDAVSALLALFKGAQLPDGSEMSSHPLQQLTESLADLTAMPNGLYLAVAMAAATIRWSSAETGRTEAEILAELKKNFSLSAIERWWEAWRPAEGE